MLLPTTTQSALLLLVAGFLCLGSWANLFKSSRWRYELFYFDFSLGALLLSVLAAYTLGTLGSDMSFADRIAVAGLKSQALALSAGFVFGLGNLLLLGGVALGGMAIAFPLVFSLAYLVVEGVHLAGNSGRLLYSAGILSLYFVAVVALVVAAQRRTKPQSAGGGKHSKPTSGVGLKTISLCVLAGLMIGVAESLGESAFWGDLGLGAYAGVLLFSAGLVAATLLFNIFLMNIGLVGGRVTLPAYLKAKLPQHISGLLGGAIWAAGLLLVLTGRSAAEGLPSWTVWLLRGWVLLAVVWGLLRWKELANSPRPARIALAIGCLAFAAAVAVGSMPVH